MPLTSDLLGSDTSLYMFTQFKIIFFPVQFGVLLKNSTLITRTETSLILNYEADQRVSLGHTHKRDERVTLKLCY